MKHYAITLLLFITSAVCAIAANVDIIVDAPSTVEVDEQFRVRFTINSSEVANFGAPSFKGFEVIYGPAKSSQSSYQIINGKTSQSSSITFTYILRAVSTGTFTIEPASIQYNGQTIKSQPRKIKVVKGRNGGGSQPNSQGSHRQQNEVHENTSTNIGPNDLFITATANRTTVYEQEAILVTYKIYTLVNLIQLDNQMPTLDGFQIQEMDLPNNKQFSVESYKGHNYRTVVWNQYVLFPQKSGNLTIPAITYEGVVAQPNRNIDPIDAYFNGMSSMIEIKKKIIAPAVKINVLPLPAKPAEYTGGVGNFTIQSNLTPETVKANEAITLRLAVEGQGNLKLLESSKVNFPADFEVYDPKVIDNFNISTGGYKGTKVFEYTVVPRHKGKYTIPAVKFCYFDTNSHSYKTLTTQPYTVNVERSRNGGSGTVNDFTSSQDVEELNHDIRYIKTKNISFADTDNDSLFGSLEAIVYGGSLLLFLIIYIICVKQANTIVDIADRKQKKANKVAKTKLNRAAQLLKLHQANEFYDEVLKALYGYTTDKLRLPREHLNKDNVEGELNRLGVPTDIISQFLNVLSDCEFARYAPGNPNENMETIYNHAISLITQIENNIKPKSEKSADSASRVLGVIVALLLLTPLQASAENDKWDDAITLADSLYAEEDFAEAADLYQTVITNKGKSAELLYNLANCYYKQDSIAWAIINYERALRLAPGDDDIKTNLAFVRTHTIDKIAPTAQTFLKDKLHGIASIFSAGTWKIIGMVAFVLMLAGFMVYRFTEPLKLRKTGFYGAAALLIITIVANLCAYLLLHEQQRTDVAIITAPSATILSSPSESSTQLFVVHEGTRIEILDSTEDGWNEVKYDDGKQGWVQNEVFEVI